MLALVCSNLYDGEEEQWEAETAKFLEAEVGDDKLEWTKQFFKGLFKEADLVYNEQLQQDAPFLLAFHKVMRSMLGDY